jgi:hypothetical protein
MPGKLNHFISIGYLTLILFSGNQVAFELKINKN